MRDITTCSPRNIRELKHCIAHASGEIVFIAGGTDWVIRKRHQVDDTYCVIYLGDVRELRRIRKIHDALYIGAACTMTEIAESNLISQSPYNAIAEAASNVGSWQIRNRGTLGGNIANASPAADLIAPLLCLNAYALILHDDMSTERIPMDKLIVGSEQTSLERNDVLLGVLLPRHTANTISHYYKLGFRKEVSIARCGVATMLTVEDDIIQNVSLAISSIGPKAVKMQEIENISIGKKITPELVKLTGYLLGEYIKNTSKRKYKAWASYGVMEDVFKQFGYIHF